MSEIKLTLLLDSLDVDLDKDLSGGDLSGKLLHSLSGGIERVVDLD